MEHFILFSDPESKNASYYHKLRMRSPRLLISVAFYFSVPFSLLVSFRTTAESILLYDY
jgi:hypothetical protein